MKMKGIGLWAAILLASAAVFAASRFLSPPAATEKLTITGSSTIAPLIAEMAKRYESMHRDVRIDVQTGGSSRGLADTRNGLAQIGMVSRSPKHGEDDLAWHPIARDGICIIVHRDNPIETLTDEEIVAVYSGAVRNWKDLGGRHAPITTVNKAQGRSTLEVFEKHFGIAGDTVRADIVIGDNQQGIKTVAGNPNAIAYVSIGAAEYEEHRGVPIKRLRSRGVEASVEHVRDGTFPVARTLHLVTRGMPEGVARNFIEVCQSALVHDLIEKQFFVATNE